jgi:biopolymer transport protein ExbB/TolQ
MGINKLFSAGGVVRWPLLGFSVMAIALIIELVRFWDRITYDGSKKQLRLTLGYRDRSLLFC